MKNLFLSLVFVTAMQSPVFAGELTSENNEFCDWKFSGIIEKGDVEKLMRVPTGSYRTGLCLDSPGGSLSEGLKMFDLIWDANFTTAVLPGDQCESACSIAFLGGSTLEGTDVTRQMDRVLWAGSKIGFHGPSLNLQSGRSYQDKDLNLAFSTALTAAARLYEVNRTQDRGDRAMTDHLMHQWLNTEFSSMYYIETVGDAILSDISVGGVDFGLKPTKALAQNACDNMFLKENSPEPGGLASTIHLDFTNTADLLNTLRNDYFSEERTTLTEVNDGRFIGFVGPYNSGTKYRQAGCVVSFSADDLARFKVQDYYYQTNPVAIDLITYTDPIAEGQSITDWIQKDVSFSKSKGVSPIYLLPFDMPIRNLPKSQEYQGALNPSNTPNSRRDTTGWAWLNTLVFRGLDLPGGDIGTRSIGDPDECAVECIGNTQCIGYTVDYWNNLCFFKGKEALTSSYRLHPKATTFMLPEFAFQIQKDTRPPVMKGRKGKGFNGWAYESNSAADFDACATSCLADEDCSAVNYKSAETLCEKFSSPGEYGTMEGSEMALKVQVD